MTDQHRNSLRVAQAFASVLIDSIDHEIKGGDSSWREESAMQLAAALRNITTPPPEVETVNWQKIGAILDGTVHPTPHIDSDRLRGPSDWDRECQESRRLNR